MRQHRIFRVRLGPGLQVDPVGFRLRVAFGISSPRNQLMARGLTGAQLPSRVTRLRRAAITSSTEGGVGVSL